MVVKYLLGTGTRGTHIRITYIHCTMSYIHTYIHIHTYLTHAYVHTRTMDNPWRTQHVVLCDVIFSLLPNVTVKGYITLTGSATEHALKKSLWLDLLRKLAFSIQTSSLFINTRQSQDSESPSITAISPEISGKSFFVPMSEV